MKISWYLFSLIRDLSCSNEAAPPDKHLLQKQLLIFAEAERRRLKKKRLFLEYDVIVYL